MSFNTAVTFRREKTRQRRATKWKHMTLTDHLNGHNSVFVRLVNTLNRVHLIFYVYSMDLLSSFFPPLNRENWSWKTLPILQDTSVNGSSHPLRFTASANNLRLVLPFDARHAPVMVPESTPSADLCLFLSSDMHFPFGFGSSKSQSSPCST